MGVFKSFLQSLIRVSVKLRGASRLKEFHCPKGDYAEKQNKGEIDMHCNFDDSMGNTVFYSLNFRI